MRLLKTLNIFLENVARLWVLSVLCKNSLLDKYRLPHATEFRHVTRDVTDEQLALSMDVVKRGDLGRLKICVWNTNGTQIQPFNVQFPTHPVYTVIFYTQAQRELAVRYALYVNDWVNTRPHVVWPRDLSQRHSRRNLSYLRWRRLGAPASSCWIYGSPPRPMDQSRSPLSTRPSPTLPG